jgi:periplasmic divalent cation tolerance protein
MNKDTRHILVLTTCPGSDTARQIAQDLVANNLAACVNNISGVQSCFRWDDKINFAEEHLLLVKTTMDRYPAMEKKILSLHPYELPEIIAVPIEAGLDAYLNWITHNTK